MKGINDARAKSPMLIKSIEETFMQPIEKLLESLNHIKCCKDTSYCNFNLCRCFKMYMCIEIYKGWLKFGLINSL